MKYGLIASAVAVFAFVLMLDGTLVGGEKDKITIKVVMQKAMKPGGDMLCKKVATGKADEKEVAQLVELFTALSNLEPPKGDADSWKAKTKALVDAAKAAKAGEKSEALATAANCNACHSEHKGKKK